VESFHFVVATRSERGLDRAAAKRIERWRKIALEASQQSRRDRLPTLYETVRLPEAVRAGDGRRFVLEESGAPPLLKLMPEERHSGERISLLTGPEGGWTDAERELTQAAGWQPASLGPAILRAETAAIAAVSVVVAAYL
jgi:16S rRNA (uracil1498-N3)-methyltransferase